MERALRQHAARRIPRAMALWDARRGLVMGDPIDGHFLMLTTNDGCIHWSAIPASKLPTALPGEGTYAASNTSIVTHPGGKAWIVTGGTTRSRVLRTTDYGATWKVADLPLVAGNDRAGAFAIAFRDDTHGIVVGGDYRENEATRANVAITTDGGITWTLGDTAHVTPFLSGVSYATVDGQPLVVAVGLRGTYLSPDEGISWKAVDRTAYNGVATIGGATLVAYGPRGRVAYTSAEALVAAATRSAPRESSRTRTPCVGRSRRSAAGGMSPSTTCTSRSRRRIAASAAGTESPTASSAPALDARDADRPPGPARVGQHAAGRQPAHLPPRRQCVLCHASRDAIIGQRPNNHGLLPRPPTRRAARTVGRRLCLDPR